MRKRKGKPLPILLRQKPIPNVSEKFGNPQVIAHLHSHLIFCDERCVNERLIHGFQ
jgi:hypothetical protein